MVAWNKLMGRPDIDAIRAYVIKRANEDRALGEE
jgi:hypothetical protein